MRPSLPPLAAFVLAGCALLPLPPAHGQTGEGARAHLAFGLHAYGDGFFEPAADAFRDYLRKAGGSAEAPRVRYLLAEALRRDNRPEEAIAAYRSLAERHPGHERADEARFRIAELLERTGKREEAVRAYSLVRSGRRRTEAAYRMAALRLAVRDWPGAVAALDAFIGAAPPEDPRVESALAERAVALDRMPRPEAAEAAYRLFVRRFPQSPRARAFSVRLANIQLRLKKFAEAENTLQSVFRRYAGEQERADLRLGQAESLLAQKKYREAGAAFEAVLKMEISLPQRLAAERGVAASWWGAGEYARAARAYRRLIRDPRAGGAHLPYLLQSVQKAGHCAEEGRALLAFALGALKAGAPLSAPARFRLAACLLDAGLREEAMGQYREVIRSSPSTREAVWSGLRLAALLEKDANRGAEALLGRYRQAHQSFQALRRSGERVAPDLERAVYQGVLRAASIHNAQKDCAQAIRLVRAVPEEHVPRGLRPEVAFMRAECAWKAGALDEAEAHFRRVLAEGGRPALRARARYRLGEAAEKRGDREEALRRFEDALPALPAEWRREARLRIGDLYRAGGQMAQARAVLLPLAGDAEVSASRRRSLWYLLARDAAASRDWKSADAALAAWDALSPPDPGEGLRLWASVAWQRKDCKRAVDISGRALPLAASGAEKAGLHRLRAACFLREGDLEKSAGALRRVLALAPDDAAAALELGEVFENMGDAEEAAGAYARFLERFPQHGRADEVALRLGGLELRRKKPAAASAAFRRASQSKNMNISGPARLQIALQLERGGERAQSLALYEELMRSGAGGAPWLRAATWRAAAIREARGEWREAIRHYQAITGMEEGNASARVKKEAGQAQARIRQLESYMASVQERELRMKNRKPLLR